jgi:uncharacterized membrane protein HdeD (DUF308 family)
MNFAPRSRSHILFIAVVCLALGACMLLFPARLYTALVVLIGGAILVLSALSLIEQYRTPQEDRSRATLVVSAVGALLGLAVMIWPEAFVLYVALVVAAFVVITGARAIADALALKQVDGDRWLMWFVLGVVTVVLGVVIALSPFFMASAIMVIAGIALLYEGACELVYGLRAA